MLCGSAAAQDYALDLFHKMQRALGGAEKIAGVRDFEQIVKATAWRPNGDRMGEVRKRVRWMRPNYLRLDQVGPGDTYVLYFDGSAGWEILPDGREADLTGGELQFAKNYLEGFRLKVWLADRIPGYTITSPGPNVLRVSVNQQANNTTVDPNTWLPVKETGISLADPDHPMSRETQFREWTTVDSIRFPSRVWVLHDGAKLADIANEEIKLNSGIRARDLAVKPAGLKPEMR
jgi:hypothetical protein